MKKIVIAVIASAVAGCAADLPLTQTTSGYPEGTFSNMSLETVENKLVGACSQVGAMVTEASPNQVVCDKAMDGQAGVFTRLLIGNTSSTSAVEKLRFVLYAVGSSVHVTAYHWAETQMVGGQVSRMELGGNNDLQQVLYRLGADDPASAHYSAESRVAVDLLKPEGPTEGVGATYYVGGTVCPVRQKPDPDSPVVKKYYYGATVKIYERDGSMARVSPDGAASEWVPFFLLSPAG